MSAEKKLDIKEIVLTGIVLAIGIQIYDYLFKGDLNLIKFAFMIILCTSILFLSKKIKNR